MKETWRDCEVTDKNGRRRTMYWLYVHDYPRVLALATNSSPGSVIKSCALECVAHKAKADPFAHEGRLDQ